MKKKNVLNSIKYYAGKNNTAFRLDKKYGAGMQFGIVVTLKEISGVNRIDDFIKNCLLRGWLVNNIAEEKINFNDFDAMPRKSTNQTERFIDLKK